jgi:cysteine-rich repeat protein
MSFYRVASWALLALGAGAFTMAGCSDDERSPSGGGGVFGSGGTGGTGGTGGSGGTGGGTGGSGGTAGSAGTAGTGGAAGEGGAGGTSTGVCGDGIVEGDEECEGSNLNGETCITLGFDSGDLVCVDCEIDFSACVGVERCYDGIDNDNDGIEDCYDDDCAAVCTDPCSAPLELQDPGTLKGNTWSHTDNLASSCLDGATSGPDMVFAITPKVTGVVEATVTSVAVDLSLSARSQCDQTGSELTCSNYALGANAVERIIVPAQQGVPIYLVVDGVGAAEHGAFEIAASSRAIVCGDGSRDPTEECDDGAAVSGDGCSSECKLESNESEPNDDVATATPFESRVTGAIDPAGDVDVVSITAASPGTNFVIFVHDLGDGACAKELMDPVVELYRNGGATLVGQDDDSGEGYCSHLVVKDLPPDTYYVFVRAAGAAAPTFPYRLDVLIDVCGNGFKSTAEECDDGNTTSGDGCESDCTYP